MIRIILIRIRIHWYHSYNSYIGIIIFGMEQDKGQKKRSVFIIDDDKFLLDMYALKFNELGFDVLTALSSEDALNLLKESKPDAILLDIVMPGMDGLEFLKKVKEDHVAESSLIIVLSNLGQESDIDQAKQIGADGYIVKASATPGEIVKKVTEYLEKQK
ncbi:response regulator [bacterium]|nr:response regulator [bacterium]